MGKSEFSALLKYLYLKDLTTKEIKAELYAVQGVV